MYVRPIEAHQVSYNIPIEDKLINLLISSRHQSKDDYLDNPLLSVENVPNTESQPMIKDLPVLFTYVSRYLKLNNLKPYNKKTNRKKNNRKIRMFSNLFRFVHINVNDFIYQTNALYSTNNLIEVLKTNASVSAEILKIIKIIEYRLKKRFKISRYNPQYIFFVLKPLCKA